MAAVKFAPPQSQPTNQQDLSQDFSPYADKIEISKVIKIPEADFQPYSPSQTTSHIPMARSGSLRNTSVPGSFVIQNEGERTNNLIQKISSKRKTQKHFKNISTEEDDTKTAFRSQGDKSSNMLFSRPQLPQEVRISKGPQTEEEEKEIQQAIQDHFNALPPQQQNMEQVRNRQSAKTSLQQQGREVKRNESITLSTNYIQDPKYPAVSNMKILTPKMLEMEDLRFSTPSKNVTRLKNLQKQVNNHHSVAQLYPINENKQQGRNQDQKLLFPEPSQQTSFRELNKAFKARQSLKNQDSSQVYISYKYLGIVNDDIGMLSKRKPMKGRSNSRNSLYRNSEHQQKPPTAPHNIRFTKKQSHQVPSHKREVEEGIEDFTSKNVSPEQEEQEEPASRVTSGRFKVKPSNFIINRYSLPKSFNAGKKQHIYSENEEAFNERKKEAEQQNLLKRYVQIQKSISNAVPGSKKKAHKQIRVQRNRSKLPSQIFTPDFSITPAITQNQLKEAQSTKQQDPANKPYFTQNNENFSPKYTEFKEISQVPFQNEDLKERSKSPEIKKEKRPNSKMKRLSPPLQNPRLIHKNSSQESMNEQVKLKQLYLKVLRKPIKLKKEQSSHSFMVQTSTSTKNKKGKFIKRRFPLCAPPDFNEDDERIKAYRRQRNFDQDVLNHASVTIGKSKLGFGTKSPNDTFSNSQIKESFRAGNQTLDQENNAPQSSRRSNKKNSKKRRNVLRESQKSTQRNNEISAAICQSLDQMEQRKDQAKLNPDNEPFLHFIRFKQAKQ